MVELEGTARQVSTTNTGQDHEPVISTYRLHKQSQVRISPLQLFSILCCIKY
jgi:hypothetical protein